VAELIAQGERPEQRTRLVLEVGKSYVLGRDAGLDVSVPWDAAISRRHVELSWSSVQLDVRRLANATNPLFHSGQPVENCIVKLGDHFVVGNTRFTVQERSAHSSAGSAQPIEEVTFSRAALAHVRFHDPDQRIEVLSHLPELIWGARSEGELYVRLVALLLAGIVQAEAAAIVKVTPEGEVQILQWDRRHEAAGAVRPSKRLVQEAVQRRRESVLHVWESSSSSEQLDYTVLQGFDWSFCTPVPGPVSEKWGLYLAGRFEKTGVLGTGKGVGREGGHLQADVKFAELVAEIVGSVRRLNHLERQQAGLRQFFPPVILTALEGNDEADLLAPRESDVTVLFCDLRGFSRRAEVSKGDLLDLLDRVSQALGVMTRHILEYGGVIGDFQGDAAMGFWGWPVATEDGPLQACRAALDIRAEFAATASQPGHPLADFQMGIGMARGRAVAGKIGTHEHVKVTVFGPVVNLASRLESMTKQLRVPILMDESLAAVVREKLSVTEGRTRRLARVLPYGMDTPADVSELLPGEEAMPELTTAHLSAYDLAVTHFIEGRWDDAYRLLRTMPPGDQAQDFLNLQIAQHNRVAPAEWNGVVRLPSK
jgi:adenylate cyclase